MIPSTFTELLWQKVGINLFEWQIIAYFIIVDYYSRFIEIAKLDRATAEAVIQCCKNFFSRHGIPKEVVIRIMGRNLTLMHSVCSRKSISFSTSPTAHIIQGVMERLNEG